MELKSFKAFSSVAKVQLLAGTLLRKLIGTGTKVGKLLDNKSLIDKVMRNGGVVQGCNDGYILSHKPSFASDSIKFKLRTFSTDHIIYDGIIMKSGDDYSMISELAQLAGVEINTIVDAGANIGTATIYFKCLFPSAKLLCIEPEPGNFSVLSENVKLNELTSVILCQNAFWVNDDELNIGVGVRGTREKELSFGVISETDGTVKVKGMTFEDCKHKLDTDRIDLLKIDIEGAEAEIIKDKKLFEYILSHTGILAIELHEEAIKMIDFFLILESLGAKHVQKGEITYCWRTAE